MNLMQVKLILSQMEKSMFMAQEYIEHTCHKILFSDTQVGKTQKKADEIGFSCAQIRGEDYILTQRKK